MGIRINQNIMAMNSYRNLTTSESSLSKSLEKLSSGFRINKAADDASGLVISEGLRSQVRGLKMAIRNTQDGVSVVQTAEGALTEVHSLLQRIRELAVQASSTGSSDPAARDAAQAEVSQLVDEVDRIATTTRFGGQQLLNGTYGSTAASNGSAAVAAIAGSVGGAEDVTLATLTVDTSAESFLLSLDGGPAFSVSGSAAWLDATPTAAELQTAIQNSVNAATTANGYTGTQVNVAVSAGAAATDVQITLTRNSSAPGTSLEVSAAALGDAFFDDLFGSTVIGAAGVDTGHVVDGAAEVIGSFASQNGTARVVGDARDTAQQTALLTNYQGANSQSFEIDASNLNGGSPITVTLNFDATDMSREEFQDAVQGRIDNALEAAGANAGDVELNIINVATGDWQAELRTRANGESLTITADDGAPADALFGNLFGDPTDTTGAGFVQAGNDQAGSVFQVGADSGETIHVNIRDIQTGALGVEVNGVLDDAQTIADLDIANDASGALAIIDAAITQVSVQRGDLGAIQNRFEHTIANLSVTVENLSASESRIRDTDMAEEMMSFTRAQILQQAGTAMLAQANSVPQSVLQLLQ